MTDGQPDCLSSLLQFAPFDLLPDAARAGLQDDLQRVTATPGDVLFREGAPLKGLYIVEAGELDIMSSDSDLVSRRGPGDVMGERGLLRDGQAMLTARVTEPATLLLMPAARFHALIDTVPSFAEWFRRAGPGTTPAAPGGAPTGLTALKVADLMARDPVTCGPDLSVTEVAQLMRDRVISSVLICQDDTIAGIVTVHDMTNKVLAEGLGGDIPVTQVMTPEPLTIRSDALGLDALVKLAERRINHLPVVDDGRLVGIIARTDLIRQQAATASRMVSDIVQADSAEEMAKVMARVPALLTHLVSAGTRHSAITRRITDITDAITRRLLALGEARLGPPPVPYLWLACGSQGRQEQTGVSDQDNCLILDDAFDPATHDAYFAALAQFVSDGLNTCGFVYCPGDMMATNPRWRQPRRVWQGYFAKWIDQPDNEAQMLASVMFDLRPIAGDMALADDLRRQVLSMARANSIFVAHMISNSLKHTPPLSLLRGFSLIRSGEHKNMVDLKHSGVVPVVDLGRVYALQGAIEAANTRDRLEAARAAGLISESGARDLVDAYDLIAELRLRHQADQIRKGDEPDNFLAPGQLSELERNHLRDAFMIVKTLQSALGRGQSHLG